FLPDANFSGDNAGHGAAPSMSFQAWDTTWDQGTGGPDTHGTLVDLTAFDSSVAANGTAGSWPFSAATATAILPVNFVNDAPSFFLPANPPAVNEDAGAVSVKDFVQKVSPSEQYPPEANEAGQTLQFNLADSNPSLFAVAPAIVVNGDGTGTLTYTLNPNVSGIDQVTVTLQDNGGTAFGGQDTSVTQTFTIVANYVNDAPSFLIAGNPPAVNEFDLQVDPVGTTGAHSVANFASNISPSGNYPPEANEKTQTVHFNVVGDTNPGLFSVPPAISPTGMLTYTLAPDVSGGAQITVDLQDNGGTANGGVDTSATETFPITVNFVNDPPIFTHIGPDQTVNEDSATTTVPGWAAASPGQGANEAGQQVTYLVTNDNNSLFATGGEPAISSSGTLTFTPGTHVFGTATVTVIAQDNGGTAFGGIDQSQPVTFHINVDQVNHLPTLAAPLAPVTVNENAADVVFSDLSKVFDDIDGASDPMTLSLGNITSPNGPSPFTASLSGPDPTTAALTFHFLNDQFGTATIDLLATDQAGTATDTISVTVNQVNQPPSFTAGGNERVAMNSPTQTVPNWATNISKGPASQSSETLNFIVSVVSRTNADLFTTLPTIDPTTGNLSFTPAANQFGKTTFSVVLHSSGSTANGGQNTSAAQTFTIEVDGAPTAIDHSYVLGVGGSSSATSVDGVLVGDTDPNGLPLSVQLVTPPSAGSVQLNADGSFTYTKGANFQATDTFTYVVNNGFLNSSVATVTVTAYEASLVEKLYQQVLGRAPDPGGLAYWTTLIQQGQPLSIIAQGIFESDERLDPIIENYYQQFLLRPADAGGLTYWRDDVWKVYGGPEHVISGMISSPEFFQEAAAAHPDLSANEAWVTALYERLLNREPDGAGLQFWTSNLDSGAMTRVDVVNGFEYSTENFQNVTIGFFQEYLNRAPTSAELAGYVQQFQQGATQRSVQIEIIDSTEYRNTPPPPSSGSVRQLS
ncbi:MAG TPA: DUF4214 domain-containing protein, partial [Pirellulales bacterium]|nr:DUF4214 domain-containing protein [Pirellulales bacterium]